MGLVSEAAAVELGIQSREDGEARVRWEEAGMVSTDVFRFGNHWRLCWHPGQERQPMGSFNTSPLGADFDFCDSDNVIKRRYDLTKKYLPNRPT